MKGNFILRDYILESINIGVNRKDLLIKASDFKRKSVLHFNPLKITYNSLVVIGAIEETGDEVELTDLGKEIVQVGYEQYIKKYEIRQKTRKMDS